MTRTNKVLSAITTLILGFGSVGCASHTGNAALIGGTAGALTGAAIGSVSHQRAGEGALLGGAIGAIGGAIVGNEMDRQGPPPQYADDYGSAPAAPYDGGVSVHYETRTYSPHYRYYYDDCGPSRYGYRTYRRYGHGGYYR